MANSVMVTKWKDTGFGTADVVKKLQERDKKAAGLKDHLKVYKAWAGSGFAVLRIDEKSVSVDFYSKKGYDKPKFSETVRKK